MVYSIDSMHLNYDRMYPKQFMQIFSSGVQQSITPERLNQINIVAYCWKEEMLSLPMLSNSSKFDTCIKF